MDRLNDKTILIADGEALIRWSLRERLEERGYRVVEAPDASHALEQAHEADLAVVDLGLPGVDGLSLPTELRRRLPGRPLILVTSYRDPEVEREVEARELGPLIELPFALDPMVRLIEDLLGHR